MVECAAEIKTILIPTRFAHLSRRAAPWAVELANRFSADLHVVHAVVPPVVAGDPSMPLGVVPPVVSPEQIFADAERDLRQFIDQLLAGCHSRPVPRALDGPPAAAITDYAVMHHVDLIVLGTNASGMLKRMVFGSVSKAILERSPCPVLMVPVRDATP